jgi:hypothetical protein
MLAEEFHRAVLEYQWWINSRGDRLPPGAYAMHLAVIEQASGYHDELLDQTFSLLRGVGGAGYSECRATYSDAAYWLRERYEDKKKQQDARQT